MQKRAVLIAGGVSRRWCYPRYAHELAWWARALVARGWECVICHGDGSQHRAFMGIAAHVVFGTQAHVTTALKWAGEAGERAMVVCANHGAPEGLSLWGSEVLTPAGLVEALGAGEAQRLIVLGQCHAGVFAVLADAQTTLIGSCGAEESSHRAPMPEGELYDEFLYQLGCALFGAPADAPQDVLVAQTVAQAFEQAQARDRRAEHPWMTDGVAGMWAV